MYDVVSHVLIKCLILRCLSFIFVSFEIFEEFGPLSLIQVCYVDTY